MSLPPRVILPGKRLQQAWVIDTDIHTMSDSGILYDNFYMYVLEHFGFFSSTDFRK